LRLILIRKEALEKERRQYSENLLDQLLKKKTDRSRSRAARLGKDKKEKKEKPEKPDKSDSAAPSGQSSAVADID
jgi:hypothetical protein